MHAEQGMRDALRASKLVHVAARLLFFSLYSLRRLCWHHAQIQSVPRLDLARGLGVLVRGVPSVRAGPSHSRSLQFANDPDSERLIWYAMIFVWTFAGSLHDARVNVLSSEVLDVMTMTLRF